MQTSQPSSKPLFDISLAQWSLHRALIAGEIKAIDFAEIAKRDYEIAAVEYVNTFYKDRIQALNDLAKEMRRRADDVGVRSLLIMCDGEGDLGDPDTAARQKAVQNHRKWLDLAAALGCHSIRVNALSMGSFDQQQRIAADGLRALTEVAAKQDLNVLVENHGGLSSNGAWLAGVMRLVNHPRCGTLPDFGNFRISADETYDRYQGVRELMPFAKAVSAKSNEFDAQGNDTGTDYHKMVKIVLDAGYRGFIGIEYEGQKLSEPDGIRATKRLLERVRTELS